MVSEKKFKKDFNALARICADSAGLSEVVFLVHFKDDWSDENYDGKLTNADYPHLYAEIELDATNVKERMYGDPTAFSSFLLHEMLHYATGAGTAELEKQKDFFLYKLGESDYTVFYNSVVAFEEQNTVRLERSIAGYMQSSVEYKKWKKSLTAK